VPNIIDRLLIIVSALIFLGFGSWVFVTPEVLESLGITLVTAEAHIDIRATYGGVQFAVAAFLLIAQGRPDWHSAGLTLALCGAAGLSAARLAGMLIEGESTPLMLLFFAVEAFGVLVLSWALLRRRSES
jgi:hypothetical protein